MATLKQLYYLYMYTVIVYYNIVCDKNFQIPVGMAYIDSVTLVIILLKSIGLSSPWLQF